MHSYEPRLKTPARRLRSGASAAEQRLWWLLRRKQMLGVQFYRQKPLVGYVVDFYAPAVGLVIEVDGSQHMSDSGLMADARRTAALETLGLRVIRFDNLQVLNETTAVMEEIYRVVSERLLLVRDKG
ncbi:endonuclease domain-containing protein [Lysobacter sp. CA196]|uniref:endonuclease domain-containing protein n=1 Tax=Lysobacter sp. CA196 TaxID=3455606 RepID=UPI003F8D6C50